MKIALQINNDTLIATNKLLQNTYQLTHTVIAQENVFKSIGFDLAEKFEKKVKTKIKNASLFDHKKTFKVSLKFHEAWALKEISANLIYTCDSTFTKNLIQKLINNLDQKLA